MSELIRVTDGDFHLRARAFIETHALDRALHSALKQAFNDVAAIVRRQRIAQLEARVKELEDICAYVADCKPHGKRYLSEAGAIGKDYGKDQAQERDYLREQLKQLEAENDLLKGRIAVDEDSHL